MSVRKMYSETSLNEIRNKTNDSLLSDLAFAEFQKNHLAEIFAPFHYDKCTVSLIETDGKSEAVAVESVVLGIEDPLDDVMASYMNAVEHDRLSELVYANAGRLFLHSDVFEGEFEQYPIFKEHCVKFDIYKVYSVGFNQIAADEFFIAFDYMGGKQNSKWHSIDPVDLEYASFPFALAWLRRRKRIGKTVFEQHMTSLAGLTRRKLEKLRRYVNRTSYEDLSQQADSIGLKLKGYDDPLYTIRDEMLTKFGHDVETMKKEGSLKLEAMEQYCFLLNMMKDQSTPLNLPEGVEMTKSYRERTGQAQTMERA